MSNPHFTLVGGPTVLIEYAGLRLITDPTFDAPGDYKLPHVTLHKTHGPALDVAKVGQVDAVLLSHDQHSDNLDTSGRAFLGKAQRVLTTKIGAQRLGGNAQGLAPWATVELNAPHGGRVHVTATPARHGPAGIEPFAGDVVGFVLEAAGAPTVYVTGDTVWYDGVADVARRFKAGIVVLFAGSAQTRGPFNLTMNVNDAIETAHAFPQAAIVPVHCDSWAHFTQDRDDLVKSFKALGIDRRLRLLEPGVATAVAPMA